LNLKVNENLSYVNVKSQERMTNIIIQYMDIDIYIYLYLKNNLQKARIAHQRG
jgi:hypothetical protein